MHRILTWLRINPLNKGKVPMQSLNRIDSCSPNAIPRPAAASSPANLSEMEIIRLYPEPVN